MDAYTLSTDIYCEMCATDIALINIDTHLKGPFTDGGGEADIPQHCTTCDLFLENPLTDIGHNYVQLACDWNTSTKHTVALKIWSDFYNIKPQNRRNNDV